MKYTLVNHLFQIFSDKHVQDASEKYTSSPRYWNVPVLDDAYNLNCTIVTKFLDIYKV